MTDDYCKLASGIILSTIWREDDHTRILWITMLAVKGRDHRVRASVPGLAAVANIPLDSCRAGLLKLMAPDPDSRTKEHEGRRIAECDDGWMILNGEKYRNFLSKQERNEYQARLMADRRAEERAKLAPVSRKLAALGQSEAEAEAEEECESRRGAKAKKIEPAYPPVLNTDAFKAKWKEFIAFRSKLKKPLLPESVDAQLKTLARYGEPVALLAIEASIANGWQGLFPEKIKPPSAVPGAPVTPRAPVDPPGWRDFLAEQGKPYTSFPMTPGWLREEFTSRGRK